MPQATETFRLSTAPSCGSRTRKSQCLAGELAQPRRPRRPSPAPAGPVRSASQASLLARHVGPDDPQAGFLQQLRLRARLVTATTGVVSAAPAATLRTVGIQLRGAVLAARPPPARRRHRRCAGRRRGCADPARHRAASTSGSRAPARASSRSSSFQGGSGSTSATHALVRHLAHPRRRACSASTRSSRAARRLRELPAASRMRGSSRPARPPAAGARAAASAAAGPHRMDAEDMDRSLTRLVLAVPARSSSQVQVDQALDRIHRGDDHAHMRAELQPALAARAHPGLQRPRPSRIRRRAGCRGAAGRRPPTSRICTKQPNSTTVVIRPSKVWPMRSRR